MKLIVDVDGTICEYDFPKIVKDFFGVDLHGKEIYAYDLADVLGVSSQEINDMFQEQVWGEPNIIEGSLETMEEWLSKGHEVLIYSNRVKYMNVTGLMDWLNKYKIPYTKIVLTPTEIDCHIDDSPAKLMSVNAKVKLLYSQNWNLRCYDITKSLTRVHNWAEIKNIIR